MKTIRLTLVFIALTLSTALFASSGNTGTEVGDTAADFSITRLDGSVFKLSDYQGKKAVNLVFWATWCSNCKAEIPALKSLHNTHGKDIELLAINVTVNDSLKRVHHYQQKHQLNYPLAFDDNRTVSKMYGVMGTPTQVIIDINGVIRYRAAETPDDIETHLNTLLGR